MLIFPSQEKTHRKINAVFLFSVLIMILLSYVFHNLCKILLTHFFGLIKSYCKGSF